MYTLWISLPTQNAAGDITITNGLGKFYTFYWGVGSESPTGMGQTKLELLRQWMDKIPLELNLYDRSCIERAVLDNYIVVDIEQRRRFTTPG